MDKKVKLVIVDENIKDLPELPKITSLKLNLNGKKSKHGKNTYKRSLSRFRRTLRW